MQQPGESRTRPTISEMTPATVAGSRFGYQLTVTGGNPAAGLPEAGLPEAGLPEAGLPEAGLPEAGLLESTRAAVVAQGGRIETDTPPVLMASFGSQLVTRLLGAFLAPGRFWPMRMVCEVVPGEQPAVRLIAAEAFGFGSLVGVEGRFRTRCQALLTDVSRDVYARLECGRASAP